RKLRSRQLRAQEVQAGLVQLVRQDRFSWSVQAWRVCELQEVETKHEILNHRMRRYQRLIWQLENFWLEGRRVAGVHPSMTADFVDQHREDTLVSRVERLGLATGLELNVVARVLELLLQHSVRRERQLQEMSLPVPNIHIDMHEIGVGRTVLCGVGEGALFSREPGRGPGEPVEDVEEQINRGWTCEGSSRQLDPEILLRFYLDADMIEAFALRFLKTILARRRCLLSDEDMVAEQERLLQSLADRVAGSHSGARRGSTRTRTWSRET
ncbi:unnamed protein product, partial [Amoebophrya sp. A120]